MAPTGGQVGGALAGLVGRSVAGNGGQEVTHCHVSVERCQVHQRVALPVPRRCITWMSDNADVVNWQPSQAWVRIIPGVGKTAEK